MALFKPFRALGLITDDVPFAVQRRGKETFVTVSVGGAWQVYKTSKLTLSLVGPELKGEITALACHGDFTFAAVNGDIEAFKRVHKCGTYKGSQSKIIQLVVLGNILLSLQSNGLLTLWNIGDYEDPQATLNLGSDFQPTCMAHPDTYLNKVIIGNSSGKVELWNIVSQKKIYTFDFKSPICCLSPSPALDVVGIGLEDGHAILHNLKYDQQVASFANASGAGAKQSLFLQNHGPNLPKTGPCTAIAFRTGQGVPLMATGGSPGVIAVWNLEERRLQTIIRDAHDAPLASLHFFAGEPRLMSSGLDNSLKQWVFDQSDGSGRLLRFRAGHSAPPTVVRSYGDGNRILSAGSDRAFRMFSTIQDQQSRELSQGHIQSKAKRLKIDQTELKLPPVTAMHSCQVRERDWANVITAHKQDTNAYTWRLQNFCLGKHILSPPISTKQKSGHTQALPGEVTSVAVSSCGNFGLVGSHSGRVDRYNLQSGLHRGLYTRDADKNAHNAPVVGLASDASNRTLITCSEDGFIRIWGFKSRKLEGEIQLPALPKKFASHPGTQLVAIADSNFNLMIFDVETRKCVRTFSGHTSQITDLSFSNDGKWLMSSDMLGNFRVWDIPSARTLQVMNIGSAVTSFSLSSAQEILATSHDGHKGIFLWANQTLFGGTQDIVPSEKEVKAYLPLIRADLVEEVEELMDVPNTPDVNDVPIGNINLEHQYSKLEISGAPEPIGPNLVTLSLLPKTQWQNLMHIEALKERSKPVQPPSKPEIAPFFLPTMESLSRNPVFNTNGATEQSTENPNLPDQNLPGWGDEADTTNANEPIQETETKGSKRKRKQKAKLDGTSKVLENAVPQAQESEFLLKLRQGAGEKDYSEFVSLLRSMSPIAVDQELQSMQVVDLENAEKSHLEDLRLIMEMAELELGNGRSYEHIQALLKAFLNIHSDTIYEQEALRIKAEQLQSKLRESWERLSMKLQKVKCLLNFVGNLPS